MPRTRFRIPDMGGYQPAVEGRQQDKTLMITGRNFAFDSKGPRSLFGTRLLAQGQTIEVEGGVAQNVLVGNKNFVFTTQGCWVLSKDKQSWIKIYDLSTLFDIVNNKAELKWTGAYLSDGIYLCHPKYGFFKAGQNVLIPKDSEDIPGLNERPIAVAETNGRLIVLGSKYVSWSGPSAAENFTPELGGAGQQLLSDRVSGVPKHLAAFQQGFLVWTDQDCMLAEFIGGDNVFRFTRVATKQIPIGAFAVENMPDGSQLICTKQGLHRIANGNEPELVAPIFNEFFREVLKHEAGITVRLTYHMEADHLYVQLRDWTNHYVRTYVLSLALDKWGIFSDRHLGTIQYTSTRGAFGYVDSDGTAHKFVDYTFNREVTPHVFEGLDSSIEFGYIRPPEMFELGDIDTLLEMQEIFLGGHPIRPATVEVNTFDPGEIPEPPVALCETLDQIPTFLLQMNNDLTFSENVWDSDWGLIEPTNYWETGSEGSWQVVNQDTNEVYSIVSHMGDYTEPDDYIDTVHVTVAGVDGNYAQVFPAGPFNVPQSTTHYLVDDDCIMIDRHDGDLWAIHNWWFTQGGTMARHVKLNNFTIQAAKFVTLWDAFDPDAITEDTGLGQTHQIVGFTDDNVIVLHEVAASRDFKLETLNKDTLVRVSQAYIQPGVGDINGPIPFGSYFGNMNFCIGPDDKVYHATFKNAGVFANGTCAGLFRYDPITGDYDEITPWSSASKPIDGPGITDTNWGVKMIFYDRAVDRIAVLFGYRLAGEPFFQQNARHVWAIGHFNTADDSWEVIGNLPSTGYLDANFVSCEQGDASWVITGLNVIGLDKNFDNLPCASPCQEYLRTVEYIWAAPGGVQDFTAGVSDHAVSGVCICVRDPAQDYAVITRFNDMTERYAAMFDPGDNKAQHLRSVFTNPAGSSDMWGVSNQYLRASYLANRKYVTYGHGFNNTYFYDYQHEYSREYNIDYSIMYAVVDP